MKNAHIRWTVFATVIVCLAGVVHYVDLLKAAVTANPFSRSAQSISHGAALWKQDCEVCHGVDGRGDGPLSASLPKHPKDLTRIALPPVFPDGVVAYRIANGGEVMPAWKDVLLPGELDLLWYYVKTRAGKEPEPFESSAVVPDPADERPGHRRLRDHAAFRP